MADVVCIPPEELEAALGRPEEPLVHPAETQSSVVLARQNWFRLGLAHLLASSDARVFTSLQPVREMVRWALRGGWADGCWVGGRAPGGRTAVCLQESASIELREPPRRPPAPRRGHRLPPLARPRRLGRRLEGDEWRAPQLQPVFPDGLLVVLDYAALAGMAPDQLEGVSLIAALCCAVLLHAAPLRAVLCHAVLFFCRSPTRFLPL